MRDEEQLAVKRRSDRKRRPGYARLVVACVGWDINEFLFELITARQRDRGLGNQMNQGDR